MNAYADGVEYVVRPPCIELWSVKLSAGGSACGGQSNGIHDMYLHCNLKVILLGLDDSGLVGCSRNGRHSRYHGTGAENRVKGYSFVFSFNW